MRWASPRTCRALAWLSGSPRASASATASLAALSAWRGLPIRLDRARSSRSCSPAWRRSASCVCAAAIMLSPTLLALKLDAAQLDLAHTESEEHVIATAHEVGE